MDCDCGIFGNIMTSHKKERKTAAISTKRRQKRATITWGFKISELILTIIVMMLTRLGGGNDVDVDDDTSGPGNVTTAEEGPLQPLPLSTPVGASVEGGNIDTFIFGYVVAFLFVYLVLVQTLCLAIGDGPSVQNCLHALCGFFFYVTFGSLQVDYYCGLQHRKSIRDQDADFELLQKAFIQGAMAVMTSFVFLADATFTGMTLVTEEKRGRARQDPDDVGNEVSSRTKFLTWVLKGSELVLTFIVMMLTRLGVGEMPADMVRWRGLVLPIPLGKNLDSVVFDADALIFGYLVAMGFFYLVLLQIVGLCLGDGLNMQSFVVAVSAFFFYISFGSAQIAFYSHLQDDLEAAVIKDPKVKEAFAQAAPAALAQGSMAILASFVFLADAILLGMAAHESHDRRIRRKDSD